MSKEKHSQLELALYLMSGTNMWELLEIEELLLKQDIPLIIKRARFHNII